MSQQQAPTLRGRFLALLQRLWENPNTPRNLLYLSTATLELSMLVVFVSLLNAQTDKTYERVTAIGAVASAVIALGGLGFAGWQLYLLRRSRQDGQAIARGNFILQFDQRLDSFDVLYHDKLDVWIKQNSHPETEKEWHQVASYLGAFERLEILIEQGSIDIPCVKSLYLARINELMALRPLRQRYLFATTSCGRHEGWRRFIKLCDLLNVKIPGLGSNRDSDANDANVDEAADKLARSQLAALVE